MARVVLTAPQPRARPVAEALRARGHEALELSFTTIESLLAASPMQPGPRYRAMPDLATFDRVIFVSPTAIEVVFDALQGPWPPGAAPAVVGPGSLEVLARRGLHRHPRLLMPGGPVFDAAALLATQAFAAPVDARVLVVRAAGGNTAIEEALARRGARVVALEAYRRRDAEPDRKALDVLCAWVTSLAGAGAGSQPTVVVTTVDAANRLGALADRHAGLHTLRHCRALAIHPRIAARLADDGWREVVPVAPGLEALRSAIESGRQAPRRPGGGSIRLQGAGAQGFTEPEQDRA